MVSFSEGTRCLTYLQNKPRYKEREREKDTNEKIEMGG